VPNLSLSGDLEALETRMELRRMFGDANNSGGKPVLIGFLWNNESASSFALVTRRSYCPGRPKKLCFTTPSLAPTVLTARLGLVKQSFFGLLGQYGRRVTRANYLISSRKRTRYESVNYEIK